jgi:predicted enzyme related to lactoylglutathione lyase
MNLFQRIALCATAAALSLTVMSAQETGIHVRAIRVLAADPESVATFYEKAFGMSETRRAANSATFKEIIINSGGSPAAAKSAQSTPLVIATRPKDAPAGAMPSLILQVPDINAAIELVKAAGGTVARPPTKSGQDLMYSFVKDPDGNQIELVMNIK